MLNRRSDRQQHKHYIKSIRVAATLLDGPKGLDEIVHRCFSYLIPLGLFKMTEKQARDQVSLVSEELDVLKRRGWIVQEQEQYVLTTLGHEEVSKRLSQLSDTGAWVRKFYQPQTASKVTLGVHLTLAMLKLPAALLSGSVGLLNDALDTLLDGLSSLIVYFGIRFNKEKSANIVLVILMLFTGLLTLYEAVRRFFMPLKPEVDWFAFLAAFISAIVCLALWAYQRYVGLRSGVLALITQSVDSRNHIIVAVSVTAGLVAALFNFSIIDTLVGLGVALLILKSTLELTIVSIRSMGEEEIDLSRYEFWIAAPFHRFKQSQLRDWMLYLVETQGVRTRSELIERASRALDYNQIPAARAMELTQGLPQDAELIDQSLTELFDHGWLMGNEQLIVTEAGRKQLKKYI